MTLEDQVLLENINLEVSKNEIHAIMGPKQSGKSHLALSLLGNPNFSFKDGNIYFKRKSFSHKSIDKRNIAGVYVSFQTPPSIYGVSNFELAKLSLKSHKKEKLLNALEEKYRALCKKLGLPKDHGDKVINNELMSEGDYRKNEILQMLLIEPQLVVLDEIEIGLEDEEVISLAKIIKEFISKKSRSAIIISQNKQLLDILNPTHVHVMVNNTIKEKGSKELYKRIITDGYSQFS